MRFAIVDTKHKLRARDRLTPATYRNFFWRAVRESLEGLGHTCQEVAREDWPTSSKTEIDAYIFWNASDHRAEMAREHHQKGGRLVCCAGHGWFDPFKTFVLSWGAGVGADFHFCQELGNRPITEAMLDRMYDVTGGVQSPDIEGDDILIAQQIDPVWCGQVVRAIRSGGHKHQINIRCHPRQHTYTFAELGLPDALRHNATIYSGKDVNVYDDLERAAIVVTQNSGTVHEALTRLKPCIAMEKHMAHALPGLILSADTQTIASAVAQVAGGWRPRQADAIAYLARLCDRQWTLDEIRNGTRLAGLIQEAKAA